MSNLTEWKDLSGKNNHFIAVNNMGTPKNVANSQNYLNGITFAKADGKSGLKLDKPLPPDLHRKIWRFDSSGILNGDLFLKAGGISIKVADTGASGNTNNGLNWFEIDEAGNAIKEFTDHNGLNLANTYNINPTDNIELKEATNSLLPHKNQLNTRIGPEVLDSNGNIQFRSLLNELIHTHNNGGQHGGYWASYTQKPGVKNENDVDHVEINNIKTIFCVFKDINDTHNNTHMTSKGQGPPTFLGSDPTKGAGSGWTMSDFGTTHTTEGF